MNLLTCVLYTIYTYLANNKLIHFFTIFYK